MSELNVIIGAQYGDEGKGKFTDIFAEQNDITARFCGGANAGHSIHHNGTLYKLHQVPSSLVRGKIGVIGNGVVLNPITLLDEIETLRGQGLTINETNLKISEKAHLILPEHIEKESSETSKKIGTTGKGIGYAYSDKMLRTNLRAESFLTPNKTPFPEIAKYFAPYLVKNYTSQMLEAGQTVLAEGAQGTMLDIDHGSYPFVTSSNTTIGGVLSGLGVNHHYLNRVIGISKGYLTRVGNGGMKTELDGELANHFVTVGKEFGVTTGRQRRVGWLNLDELKYACELNGFTELILTKLDVMSGLDTVDVYLNDQYITFEGWGDISEIRQWGDLPDSVMDYVWFIEDVCDVNVSYISVGPEREAVIEVKR